jgi:hypothetical protein
MMIAEEIISGYYRIRNYVKNMRDGYIKSKNCAMNLKISKKQSVIA